MAATKLVIAEVLAPTGALFGLTHCPGRCGGAYGERELDADLAQIEAWGATLMLTLVEAHEFARLGVPSLAAKARRQSFDWHHVPIPDFGTPSDETRAAWAAARPAVAAAIDHRERILVHCAAGLGRTGTVVARLLVDLGVPPIEAINRVRAARPGAIETVAQMAFVQRGERLL